MAKQDSAQTTDPDESWFVVLHNAVGNFFKGQVISLTHLKAGQNRDIDTDRLIGLGAIAPVGSAAAASALDAVAPDAVTPAGDLVNAPVPEPLPDPATTKAVDAAKSATT